jgi:hypothetical protein
VERNASDYRDYWELARTATPRHRGAGVHRGALAEVRGIQPGRRRRQDDREKWAFSAIEHLFDEVARASTDYRIFGHSAGAQFVQRMALFAPTSALPCMVAPTRLVRDAGVAQGQARRSVSLFARGSEGRRSRVKRALATQVRADVGERTTRADYREPEQSAAAKKQGDSRVDRG